MRELKKQLEAILFSVARSISTEELCQLTKKDTHAVKEALLSLMADLESRDDTPLVLLNDADTWKLTIRQEYTPLVKSVVTETELSKSVLETLAVIAFKYPIKQSDLIRIRTNKAYEHLGELEQAGFITRQRYGRSKLIKLTDKFFSYFDLPREKLKERFKGFDALAKTIEGKEGELEERREEAQRRADEARKEKEEERKVMDGEIDLLDREGEAHALESYAEENTSQIREDVRKIGEMEIIESGETEERGEDAGTESPELPEPEERQAEPAPRDPVKEALRPGKRMKSVDEVLGWGRGKKPEKGEQGSEGDGEEEGKGKKQERDDETHEDPPDKMPEVQEDAEVPGEKPGAE